MSPEMMFREALINRGEGAASEHQNGSAGRIIHLAYFTWVK